MPDSVSGLGGKPIQPLQPPDKKTTSGENAASASKSLFEQLWEMLCGGGGFIANWNAMLGKKGETLNYFRSGLSGFTQVLQWMSDFSGSSNNFDFNNWLNGQGTAGNRKGTLYDGSNKRDDYVKKAEDEQANIKKARDQITKEEKQNDQDLKDGKITQKQHDELKKKLDDTDTRLKGASANLTKYITELKAMRFTYGDTPGTFKIVDANGKPFNMGQFKADEKAISDDPKFGLTGIFNDAQNTATEYQTLSTTAQMEVSLIMNQTEQIMQIASSIQSSLFSAAKIMMGGVKGQ